MDKVIHVVHFAMQNLVVVGFMGFLLIVVPIIGIMAIHESKPPTKNNGTESAPLPPKLAE